MTPFVVSGRARLDNRRELVAALGLDGPESRCDDLTLAGRAYARWGDACAGRFLGDYALTVRDSRSGRVFAVRDALGAEPLCYRATPEGIDISGSASAIAGPAHFVSADRIADVLVGELECADRTTTMYRDVMRLPPGHTLVYEDGRVRVMSYWSPDVARASEARGDREHEEAFLEAFHDAVRCRLDGGTASMLSGGLDSSAIVGCARTSRRSHGEIPLTTLSAITDAPGCEETRSVRSVLALPGLAGILLRPGDVGAYSDEILNLLRSPEEPFDVAMIIPLMVYAEARRRGFTSVLDGVDGDCVASLEPDYVTALFRSGRWVRGAREAIATAAFYRGTYAPWGSWPRSLARHALRAAAPRWATSAYRRATRPTRIEAALSTSIIDRDFARSSGIAERLVTHWDRRGAALWSKRGRHAVELTHPQIAAALERYHRVATSQGIQARHPFFDRRLVELCLALPWDQKARDGWSKSIVRRSLRGLVPAEVLWRRGRWVRLGPVFFEAAVKALRETIDVELHAGLHELAPYVDRVRLARTIADFQVGVDPAAAETVWHAVALNSWLRNARARRYDHAARANGPTDDPALPVSGEAIFFA